MNQYLDIAPEVKAALDAGGRDNVTLVIVHDGEEPA